MNANRKLFTLAAVGALGLSAAAVRADWEAKNLTSEKACKMCHKSAKRGNQYGIWKASPHAKAYTTLGTDAAKAIGQKQGIANPPESGKCLKCHSTAYGFTEAKVTDAIPVTDGITCQTCHGPAKKYKTMHPKHKEKAYATLGLVRPDETVCKRCHNEESPAFKGFNFVESAKKIAHPLKKK